MTNKNPRICRAMGKLYTMPLHSDRKIGKNDQDINCLSDWILPWLTPHDLNVFWNTFIVTSFCPVPVVIFGHKLNCMWYFMSKKFIKVEKLLREQQETH